jgi:hypothetical protein
MADDLSVAVERLRTSAQRLNEITDAAAQLVKDVETFLEEARVGLSAAVSIGPGFSTPDADAPDWEDSLSYRRLASGKFRLVIVRKYCNPSEPTSVRAWSECSRDEKIESLAKLPELLVELSNRVNDKTDKAEQVLAVVAPQLPTVKKRKGGE